MTIEICMPVYRCSPRIKMPLTSLLHQTDTDFYVTIYDNTPAGETSEIEKTKAIIKEFTQENMRITYINNEENVGYGGNIRKIFTHASGDIIILLADDDTAANDMVSRIRSAFEENENAGIVARPYYWFTNDITVPVRFEGAVRDESETVNIDSDFDLVWSCISCAAQLSGLAFRRESAEKNIPADIFTAHIYPFLKTFKHHSCVLLPQPTIAVSISTSMSRSNIYEKSPLLQWIELYDSVFTEPEYRMIKDRLIDRICSDFLGFAQIKNYGTYKQLFREIKLYAKYRKKNLTSPSFYLFAAGSVLIPRFILIRLIDMYKRFYLAKKINKMNIDFSKFIYANTNL